MSLQAVAGARHCSEAGCRQLDFLPFTCDHCSRVFCLAHHKVSDHSCVLDRTSVKRMPSCPVCNAFVYVPADASPDAIVNAHLLSRCQLHLLSSQRDAAKGALSAATRCDQPTGCRNVEKYATMQCKRCGGQFCIAHRLEATHRCLGAVNKSSSAAAAASAANHSKGHALLEKLKAKREAKEAAQAAHDRQHAQQFPTAANAAAAPGAGGARPKPYTTLQQIRAGINSAGAATMAALSGVLPTGMSGSAASSSSAAAASAGAAASPSPSPSPSASPQPSAVPRAPLALTLAMKRAALGDPDLAESSRRYLQVDATAIRSKRAPALCYFNQKHSLGKVLDLICEQIEVDNENHLASGKRLYINCPRMNATFPAEFTLASLDGVLLDGDTISVTRKPISPQA